jgi:hypothetical protein
MPPRGVSPSRSVGRAQWLALLLTLCDPRPVPAQSGTESGRGARLPTLGAVTTPAATTAEDCHRAIRSQRLHGHSVPPELTAEIAALAVLDPRPLMAVLLAGETPPVEAGQSVERLNRYQERLLLDGLAAAPIERVAPLLPSVEWCRTSGGRMGPLAVRLRGAISSVAETFTFLAEWRAPADPREPLRPLDSELRQALRDALADHLRRDPRTLWAIAKRLRVCDPEESIPLLLAAGDAGDPRIQPALAEALSRPGLDRRLILSQILRLGPGWDSAVNHRVAEAVAWLLTDPSDAVAAEAARALEALAVPLATESLLEMLATRPATAPQAHQALVALAGIRLPAHVELWRAHLDEQDRFLAEELEGLLGELERATPEEAASALRRLSGRGLLRDSIAESLSAGLAHRPERVRDALASHLGRLDSRAALDGLIEALEWHPQDVPLREALVRLTGVDCGAEAYDWRQWLDARRAPLFDEPRR